MRPSLTARAVCLLAFAAVGLSGCGLKGDLYLPVSDTAKAEQTEDDSKADDATDQH